MKQKQAKIICHIPTTARIEPAEKRGHRTVQPETEALTQQPTGKDFVAEAPVPQVTTTDPGKYQSRGWHRRASQHYGKRRKPIYDPLIGNHRVPVVKVSDLMELIVSEDNFLRAIHDIGSAPRKACGIDKQSVRDVCEQLENSADSRELIRENLLFDRYRPNWVKVIQIPKPNGGQRTLGIATVQDRIVQRMILNAVEDHLPGYTWSAYSYAYLRGHSIANAIAEVNKIREEGYKLAVKLDLKSFFDNVPHDRLFAKLERHIRDSRVVSLIKKFLTPVMCDAKGGFWLNRIGSPQGSIISPWLTSKLYLDELDGELEARGYRFVRYADDVTVFCRSAKAARRVKAKLIDFVERVLKCPVNREKTQIVDIRHLALFGVVLVNGVWQIDPKKEKEYCAMYLSMLDMYKRTRNEAVLDEATCSMKSTIAYYERIPGISARKIKALQRWAARKRDKTLSSMPPEDTPHRKRRR